MAANARVNSRAGFAAAVPIVFLLAASVLAPRPAAAQQALTVDQVAHLPLRAAGHDGAAPARRRGQGHL